MIKALKATLKFIINHPLNRNRKLAGIVSFVAWQFKSRWSKGQHIINWISGIKLSVANGMTGATGAIYVGLPEFNDMGFVLHFLREEDCFIDVGANVGIYSLLASGIKRSTAVAFEPIPATYDSLMRNLKLNELDELVGAYNMGIGSKKDSLKFTSNYDTVNHVVFDDREGTVEVKVDQLDNLVKLEEGQHTLLKIDVEGFEMEVLKGAKSILTDDRLKAVILEMNGCGEQFGISDEDLDKKITEYGFKKYDYNPLTRKLTALESYNREGNTLYLRNLDFIIERLNSAKPVFVYNTKF